MNRSGNGQPVRPQGTVPADLRTRMNGAGAANAANRPPVPRPANPVNSVNRAPAGNPGNPGQVPNRMQAPINGQPPVRRAPVQNPVQNGAGNSVPAAHAAHPQNVRSMENMPASAPVSAKKTPEPVRPVPTPQPVQRKFPEDGLMRTKTTDLAPAPSVKDASSVKKTEKAKKAEKKEREYAGSDEGGNTVVSVIKAVVYIIFVLIVSVFLSITMIAVANDIYAFVKSDEVVEVTIPEYATLEEVSEILYKNDIIKYPTIFKLYAVAEHDNGEFLAGTYSVTPMMNYTTLLGEFKEKPVSGVARITIPEGYTTDEIINLMVANGIGTREGYEDVIQNYDFDYWFIDELEASGRTANRLYRLDGYLFPDTYEFYKNSSEATVIGKLLKRFSQIFTREYRDQCAALGYSVDQMITLASMIEKEAASPSEFFWVSSVFHNRLNNPWSFPKLESD
ncbi:MAG: endolytic transglycosylase MltG, partial [Clostridia bacterium]|nr:endolytic transglycosylase MltG [Clostridia bacterium]